MSNDTKIDLGAGPDAEMTDEQFETLARMQAEREEAERLAQRSWCEKVQDYFEDWYMCTMLGHKFHMTETVCVIMFLLSLFGAYLMMKGATFNDGFMMLAVFLISLGGVFFIWGYLDIASLSEQANALQVVAAKSEQENEQFKKINDALTEQTDLFVSRVEQLGNEVGMIQDGVNKLGELIGPIRQLQESMEQLNSQQIEIGDAQDALVNEQEQATKDEELDTRMKEIMQSFRMLANNPEGIIQGAEDIRRLRETFQRRGIQWNEKCDEVVADGRVYKYEMLAIMDEILKTRYYRLRDAPKERDQYEKMQADRIKELKDLATKLSIPHSKIRILRPPEERRRVHHGQQDGPSVIELTLAKRNQRVEEKECKLDAVSGRKTTIPSHPPPPPVHATVPGHVNSTPPPTPQLEHRPLLAAPRPPAGPKPPAK